MENSPIETKTSINIDKKDIVDVALAKIESTFLLKIKSLKQEVFDLTEKVSLLNKEIEDSINEIALLEVEDGFNYLVEGGRKLGCKKDSFSVKGSPSLESDYMSPKEITISVICLGKITIFTTTVEMPSMLSDVSFPERKAIFKEIEDKKKEVVDIKEKLRKLPAMERQIKARVVEAELNKSEFGRSVLLQLDSKYLDDMIKQICE